MKDKFLYQYFMRGSFVYVVLGFDSVSSGIFLGITENKKALVRVGSKNIPFDPDNLFPSQRMALLYSRFIEGETDYYFFPSFADFAIKKRALGVKIVDHVHNGIFVRELDIEFPEYIIDSKAALMTKFEVNSSHLNSYTKNIALMHQTHLLDNGINNQPVQVAFFACPMLNRDFAYCLN